MQSPDDEQGRPGVTTEAAQQPVPGPAASVPLTGLNNTAFDRLISALESQGCSVRTNGDGKAMAGCPAHDDHKPSLSVSSRRDGKGVVVHCHAGCPAADIVAALNMTMSDLFDEAGLRAAWAPTRDYAYPGGRRVHRKRNKQFPQSGNMADDSLFHADRIGYATTVYVPEGEKDVEAIEAVGGTASARRWAPARPTSSTGRCYRTSTSPSSPTRTDPARDYLDNGVSGGFHQ